MFAVCHHADDFNARAFFLVAEPYPLSHCLATTEQPSRQSMVEDNHAWRSLSIGGRKRPSIKQGNTHRLEKTGTNAVAVILRVEDTFFRLDKRTNPHEIVKRH